MAARSEQQTASDLSERARDDLRDLRRVRSRDPEAIRSLYQRNGAVLYSLALRMLRSSGEAEELVQEVFCHLWDHPDRYDEKRADLRVYLVQLTRSRCLDRLRTRRRRAGLLDQAVDSLELDVDELVAATQLESAVAAEEHARLRRAFATLPADQQRAIVLHYFEGLSHSEISERLGEPLGTVKTRLRRGLLRLRDLFERPAEEALPE